MPPAGSTLSTGMELGDGDRPEHFPYVASGYAVLSFEIDGYVPDLKNTSEAALMQAAQRFRDSQAGLANARAAHFVLAEAPQIDRNRLYIAGHSSAATLALLTAAHDQRIKGCISYCGVTDVEQRLAPVLSDLDRALPGYRAFIRQSSQKSHASRLTCPVLLFHAEDDSNVPVHESTSFADQLRSTNPSVTLITTPTGDHYNSMIREGIPKGIQWLNELQRAAH